MKINKKIPGFTLIDLMVAMTVIGIGLAITIPAMQNFTNDNRKAEHINKLVRDMTYAKSEAVNRGETFCIATKSGAALWDGGWQVTDAATATVFRDTTTLAINGQILSSSTGTNTICFRPDGSANAAALIELCAACVDVVNREKQIGIGATGRISLNSQFACVPAAPACP